MKLLTASSVDYFEWAGLERGIALNFSNVSVARQAGCHLVRSYLSKGPLKQSYHQKLFVDLLLITWHFFNPICLQNLLTLTSHRPKALKLSFYWLCDKTSQPSPLPPLFMKHAWSDSSWSRRSMKMKVNYFNLKIQQAEVQICHKVLRDHSSPAH